MRLILAALLLAAPALADDDPISIGTEAGWQLLGGVTGGGSFGDLGGSGFVGGELSLNRLSRGAWMGLYTDGFFEFGQSVGYTTAGMQFGYRFLGVDGGIAFRGGDDEPPIGYAVRGMLALAMFDLYGRVFIFDDQIQTQIGVLLKLPLWASE